MYGMDDLETLLLAGAVNLDGSEVYQLTGELGSLNLLDVTGLWGTFDLAERDSLNAWGSIEGNTLVVPEPTMIGLIGLGGLVLMKRRAH